MGQYKIPFLKTQDPPDLGIIALNRMGFGPKPGDLDRFNTLGTTATDRLNAYIDEQTAPGLIDDSSFDSLIGELYNAGSLSMDLETLWDTYITPNPEWSTRIRPLVETERMTMNRAIHSKKQLQELLVDFWHNHFNLFGLHYLVAPLFPQYDRDVIRPYIFGNFREMLGAVARSPQMLYYLDGFSNKVAGPNENFARELFDLHTQGIEHYQGVKLQADVPIDDIYGKPVGYVDEDVYEAARCFTGWSVNEDPSSEMGTTTVVGNFTYRDDWHDRFQKFVLGERLPADQAPLKDGEDVMDILCQHPATARHISKKLIQRLVSDTPTESLIESTATLFLQTYAAADQLKQVVSHILRSDDFKNTWGEKIKRPYEYNISVLRALDTSLLIQMDDFDSDEYMWHYAGAGQLLFQWPSPDGYPELSTHWLSTTSFVMSWRLIKHMLGKTTNNDGVTFYCDIIAQTPVTEETPSQLAQYWVARLLNRPIDNDYLETVIAFIGQHWDVDAPLPYREDSVNGNNYKDKLRTMVAIILQSPEFVLK